MQGGMIEQGHTGGGGKGVNRGCQSNSLHVHLCVSVSVCVSVCMCMSVWECMRCVWVCGCGSVGA